MHLLNQRHKQKKTKEEKPKGGRMISYITVATQPHRQLDILQKQYKDQDLTLQILGMGDTNLTPQGRNYGVKIGKIHEFLTNNSTLPPDSIIIFTDAYDVLLNGSMSDVVQKYALLKCDILFGAEANCHPYPLITEIYPTTNVSDQSPSPYPYLNSGMFIGTVEALLRIFNKFTYNVQTDDQGYWTRVFLSQYIEDSTFKEGNKVISLDYHATILQNMNLAGDHIELTEDGTYRNKLFDTKPNVLHFPGNAKDYLSICEKKQPLSAWSIMQNNMYSEIGIAVRYYKCTTAVWALLAVLLITICILLLLYKVKQ